MFNHAPCGTSEYQHLTLLNSICNKQITNTDMICPLSSWSLTIIFHKNRSFIILMQTIIFYIAALRCNESENQSQLCKGVQLVLISRRNWNDVVWISEIARSNLSKIGGGWGGIWKKGNLRVRPILEFLQNIEMLLLLTCFARSTCTYTSTIHTWNTLVSTAESTRYHVYHFSLR